MPRVTAASVRAAVAALGVLVVGLVLRRLIIGSVLGEFNADEASSGLHSLGVIRDGRFPVVINGQAYTAVIDAYLFSPLVAFADGSAKILKWLYVCMWATASAVTYFGARRLSDRRSAAVAAALVWLAPGALLVLSTKAYMGYAIGLAVVSATIWATAVVADQTEATARHSATVGLLAGLAFYIHPMFATVLAPVIAVAAVVHRRDWRRWWLPASLAAIAANLPFLAWNATNGWPSLESQGPPGSYSDRLSGFVTGLLPRALGLRAFDGRWVFAKPLALVLYAAIVLAVVTGCVLLIRAHRRPSRWIVTAGLIGCLPLMALLSQLIYVTDGRYAIIPLPLMAIAIGATATHGIKSWHPQRAMVALAGVVTLWVAITTLPFLDRQHAFDTENPDAWQDRVISRLDELGIDRIAGNYWLVLPIEYRSDRSIRAAIAGNPYVIRFPESQRIVNATSPEQVAFVFPPGEQDPGWFYLSVDSYRREDLAGVVLYVPFAAGE
ncbi:MAG: hypothetical protein HY826_02845 [Actinobacteria bacterium]|nr:hypothetical protein [Actinomycetota bacterium]